MNKNQSLRKFLTYVKILFVIQTWFHYILPSLDTFLDLGQDIHDTIRWLYKDPEKNSIFYAYRTVSQRVRRGSNITNLLQNDENQQESNPYDHNHLQTSNVVCIPGAGFSGFWYSIGRLHALKEKQQQQHPEDLHYDCFSAGCLGAVVTVLNQTVDDVLDIAIESQQLWQNGKISRFEIVEFFVNGILTTYKEAVIGGHKSNLDHIEVNDLPWVQELSNIWIATTGRWANDDKNQIDAFTMKTYYYSRQATNFQQLKELLIQTTWM